LYMFVIHVASYLIYGFLLIAKYNGVKVWFRTEKKIILVEFSEDIHKTIS
jgi:hypothetical protein